LPAVPAEWFAGEADFTSYRDSENDSASPPKWRQNPLRGFALLGAPAVAPCDFLVTWNCRHIANANKFGHIRRVNDILGLGNPALVAPLELLNEDTIHG